MPSPSLLKLTSGILMLNMLLSGAAGYTCDAKTCHGSLGCKCPSTRAPGGLLLKRTPQFIVITTDDAVDALSYTAILAITAGLKNRNGCPLPATWFVTTTDTKPELVQALYLGNHEIATHTMTHPVNPSAAEIVGARRWLADQTGIPAYRIVGYRAPNLEHSPAQRQILKDNGFLYDSSMSDYIGSPISPSAQQRGWPYTFDYGNPQPCWSGSCRGNERYKGLWEMPLWAVHDATGRPIADMDPGGDPYNNYRREFDWRYRGNRAPLGIYLHGGLETAPERVASFRRFLAYALAQPDTWVVTNKQLIAWMRKPVPAPGVGKVLTCPKPTDIDKRKIKGGKVCSQIVLDCVYGSWDAAACRCKCMGEGQAVGYCRAADGRCTSLNC